MADLVITDSLPSTELAAPGEPVLGFSLNFISGRGLLTTKQRKVGALEMKILEMEIPNIAFPFDVTGGAERFKTRRCLLRHLVFSLEGEVLADLLAKAPLREHGFVELKVALRDGFAEFSGRFAVGDTHADITMRAAVIARSATEIAIPFYDIRVYGFLPIPACLLPMYLLRALSLGVIASNRTALWTAEPAEQFLRTMLPHHGWKIPDTSRAQLVTAEIARGRITLALGPEGEPTPRQISEREPSAEAVLACEGMTTFAAAEEALSQGKIVDAYDRYREALDDERGNVFARERLLQIGAADPDLALETRQLAEEVLAQDPNNTQALLALASIALRERSWGEAANRYGALAEAAHQRKDRFDIVAAELAAAAAAAPIDPKGALGAYERAAARARDSVAAHQALFELRQAVGDWEGAVRAGDKLVRLVQDPMGQAAVHRNLAQVYRLQLRDFRKARVHFERALRLVPEDPVSLEGLAETYAARGEPARAASYLGRLAEQAEASADKERIIALNLRLGEIWERWLHDNEAAATRYFRVLDVDPRNRTARLRLAALAEQRGDLVRARSLYEDVLGAEDLAADPQAIPDLVAAYTRLARVTLSVDGAPSDAVACLERAVELDPQNRLARDELAKLLRSGKEWGRLLHLLEDTAQVVQDASDRRRAHMDAARIELAERRDAKAALEHLEAVLDDRADDLEALDLFLPLAQSHSEPAEILRRLQQAAQVSNEAETRGELLFRIAQRHGTGSLSQQSLLAALAVHPYHEAAATWLYEQWNSQGTPEQQALACQKLSLAVRDNSRRLALYLERAKLLRDNLGRGAEAEATLMDAVRLSGNDSRPHLMLSQLRLDQGDTAGARLVLERGLTSISEAAPRAELHLKLADLFRVQGEDTLEADHLRQALDSGAALGERHTSVQESFVAVMSRLQRYAELAQAMELWALQGAGASVERWRMHAAELLETLGDSPRAVAIYRALLDGAHPRVADAARALARLAESQGDWATVSHAIEVQLKTALPHEDVPLLEKWVDAHARLNDAGALEIACMRLLERETRSGVAHVHLARLAERRSAFVDALTHWTAATQSSLGDAVLRREAYGRAAALALEFEPESHDSLRHQFVVDFPETPASVLSRPLGEILAAESAWEPLLQLRRFQLQRAKSEPDKARLLREIAQLLYRRLGRAADAVPFYQEVIAQRPNDFESRHALMDIFRQLQRPRELAALLFAMSQLMAAPAEATNYALRAAETYVQQADDRDAAFDVLRSLCAREDIDPLHAELLRTLRSYELHDALVMLHERSMEQRASITDGRFVELVELLLNKVGAPKRAWDWCERLSQSFPAADEPRIAWIDIATRHPELGDIAPVLQSWANARQGGARARILEDLATREASRGNLDASQVALLAAAEADPHAEGAMRRLVEHALSGGNFSEAIRWLEQLAKATPVAAEAELRWRELYDVARGSAKDNAAAIRALEGIANKTTGDYTALAELYLGVGTPERLASLVEGDPKATKVLAPELMVAAAQELLNRGGLEDAKRCLHAAAPALGAARVFEIAEPAFRDAQALAELGEWRLEVAESQSGDLASLLKVQAYADLVEGGASGDKAIAQGQLADVAGALDLRNTGVAWSVYRAARAGSIDALADEAARLLVDHLPTGDDRLPGILNRRATVELAAGNYESAVALGERLTAIGDPAGERIVDEAFGHSGRREELVQRLAKRAAAGGSEAGALWLRVATLELSAKRYGEAGAALDAIPPSGRQKRWAEVAQELGQKMDDPARELLGASLLAEHAESDEEAAKWLRRSAHLSWWRLDNEDEARTYLAAAQKRHPLAADKVKAFCEGLIAKKEALVAAHILEESLVTLHGSDAGDLLLLRVRAYANAGLDKQAKDSLTLAESLMGDDAAQLGRLGDLAEALGDFGAAVSSFERAYALAPDAWEEHFLSALGKSGDWSKVVAVLTRGAENASAEARARRLERAAEIAAVRLSDADSALRLAVQSVDAAPTESGYRRAFELASRLGRWDTTLKLGTAFLALVGADSRERGVILRGVVDAYAALHRLDEAEGLLSELAQLGAATPHDILALARLLKDRDRRRSAELFDRVVGDTTMAQVPEVFVEAASQWALLGDATRARQLALEGQRRGVRNAALHLLLAEVGEGAERLPSIEYVIAERADAEWSAEKRARLRMDLAKAKLHQRQAGAAKALLVEASELSMVRGWATLMEAALTSLGEMNELARLWLADPTGGGVWSEPEQAERLRAAARVFREHELPAEELRTLERLQTLDPNADELVRLPDLMATLGDKDRYFSTAMEQLAAAAPHEQVAMALGFGQTLLEKLGEPRRAWDLVRELAVAQPNLALSELAGAAAAAAGLEGEAAALDRISAERCEGALKTTLLLRAASRYADVGSDTLALECYKEAFVADPKNAQAQEGLLLWSETLAQWDDFYGVCSAMASGASSNSVAHDLWVRAADAAEGQLGDPVRALDALRMAWNADASRTTTGARLAHLEIKSGDVERAVSLLVADGVASSQEVTLATLVAEKVAGPVRTTLLEWLAQKYPEHPLALQFRLDGARGQGDSAALRALLIAQLEAPGQTPGSRASLHQEIAETFVREGDLVAAFGHLQSALRAAPTLATVQQGLTLADTLGDAVGGAEAAVEILDLGVLLRPMAVEAAAHATGEEKGVALTLLGRLCDHAGEEPEAIAAYTEALNVPRTKGSFAALQGLGRIYARRGDWQRLAELYHVSATSLVEAGARAEAHYQAALIARDHLVDEALAERYFKSALGEDDRHRDAHTALGLLLHGQQKFGDALIHLQTGLGKDLANVPRERLLTLIDCYKQEGMWAECLAAIDVAGAEPSGPLLLLKAETLDGAGREKEAEEAWLAYAEGFGDAADADTLQPIYVRLAKSAGAQGRQDDALRYWEQAHKHKPEDLDVLKALRAAYEATSHWQEAVDLRLREAAIATDPKEQLGHYRVLADTYATKLNDNKRAAAMLEKACGVAPDDAELLSRVVQLQKATGNWAKFLVWGERWLALKKEAGVDGAFLADLGKAYEEAAGDSAKARSLYAKALAKSPNLPGIGEKMRELAQASGDFKALAAMEEDQLLTLAPGDDKVARLKALAEIYLKNLSSPEQAAVALTRAREIRPRDREIIRRTADLYALDAKTYAKALEHYRSLLEQAPLDAELLRIVARLSGQLGDTDRAYGFYSALLLLSPRDTEAERFVTACRAARPLAPQRAITDADRAAGLLHPGQSGPYEEVYTPLARFAELTQPGDLGKRGVVAERDALAPTDPRRHHLQKVLEALALGNVKLLLWRVGGFACDIELQQPPAVLVGSVLATDTADRQRAFLVARAADLYRSGHLLCERLNATEQSALIAALCQVIVPGSTPVGANADSERWAQVMKTPLTPQIRQMLAPKVQAFMQKAPGLAIADWRTASLSSASRTAMLISCDVHEAVTALLRLRGHDGATEEQRLQILRDSPEEFDLLRFALSDHYFKLRGSVGLALRKAK